MKPEKAGAAAAVLLSVLGRTWRIRRLRVNTGIKGNGVLYAFWHGVQLPLIHTHRNMGARILISRSRDGTIVSTLCEKLGFRPVRGSSSRDGAGAARELVKALTAGALGAITPDGPRGPARVVKKGVSEISRRSRTPVLPCGVSAFPAIRLGSWDRFMIPLPFASVSIAEGRPVPPEHCTTDTLTAAIDQQQKRAELDADPVAGIIHGAFILLGYLVSPLAFLLLLFRPELERKERQGRAGTHHGTGSPVWLHGASLGELKGLMPVMDRLKEADVSFFVTCTTPAGRHYLESQGIQASFLPLDLPGPVNRFLDTLSPSALILAETEFWPILLYETVGRGIPASMLNARLSAKSVRGYRIIKPLFMGILNCFRSILTRSDKDTERFVSLGVSAETAGDGKAQVQPPKPPDQWKKRISAGRNGILVAGSTRKGEEEVVLDIAAAAGMTPVLVPRHDGRNDEIADACRKRGFTPSFWTGGEESSDCLIVNVKGVLSALYGLADLAFVGGTLVPVGGHNILEPLTHGVPVIIGPHSFHFTEMVNRATKGGVCRTFETVEEGVASAMELMQNPGDYTSLLVDDFTFKMEKMLELMEIADASR